MDNIHRGLGVTERNVAILCITSNVTAGCCKLGVRIVIILCYEKTKNEHAKKKKSFQKNIQVGKKYKQKNFYTFSKTRLFRGVLTLTLCSYGRGHERFSG